MTDPKTPDQPPIKDAVPDGKEHLAPARQLTFSQQVFIWSMIIIVGVIFGIGSSVTLLWTPSITVVGVAEGEAVFRRQLSERLARVLDNPQLGYFSGGDRVLELYASDLRVARLAEARGLMPKGVALDRLEERFLATPLSGSSSRTYLDALNEHIGGADEIRPEDLRRYLAERAARQGLYLRSAIAPAMPRAIAGVVKAMAVERAELVEVVLSGERLIPEVKADDPEIAAAYTRLRGERRFTRPAGVRLTVAVASAAALAAGITPDEAALKAWYDAHTDQFPGDPGPGPTPPPKPFEAVRDQVLAKVRHERASAAAQQKIAPLAGRDDLDGVREAEPFRAAATEAGLELVAVEAFDRTPGTVDLGRLGTVQDIARIFGKEHEPGFLTRALPTSTGDWVVMRLESRTEPGFQELDEVRPEVVRLVAAQRAERALIEEAGRIREALSAKGPGALAAWASSDEAKPWKASLSTRPAGLTDTLPPPAGTAEPALIAALAMAARPVAVVRAASAAADGIPTIRLVQVAAVSAAERPDLSDAILVDHARRTLQGFGEKRFSAEIEAQLSAP